MTVVIVSGLAVLSELVNDKRPKPPRTVTPVFAVGSQARSPARSSRHHVGHRWGGLGAVGAVLGTMGVSGTYEAGGCPWRPRPASALLED